MNKKENVADLFAGFAKALEEAKEKYVFEHEIVFPMEIKGIKKSRQFIRENHSCPAGSLVKIRPCGKEYEDKTYLGIFLGDLAIDTVCRLDRKTKELDIIPHTNPAIFVPDLQKIFFGCESWWGRIGSEKELKEITVEDIENTWYVQLLKTTLKEGETERDEE